MGTTNGLHLDSPERKYFLLLWPIERITPKDNQRFFFKSDRLVVVLSTNILPRKFNWLSKISSKKFFWLTFTTCNLTNWAFTISLDMYAARHQCCQLWLFLNQVKKVGISSSSTYFWKLGLWKVYDSANFTTVNSGNTDFQATSKIKFVYCRQVSSNVTQLGKSLWR